MEKKEIEELRGRVPCSAVLEKAGFAIDLKESTRRAVKYRRDNEIIIMIHDGQGWFDPLSEAKGDVFSLVGHLDGVGFLKARDRVAHLIGYVPCEPAWNRPDRPRRPDLAIVERWRRRQRPWPGSPAWRYLVQERCLPDSILRLAVRHDLLREGPYGSMWAAHTDQAGLIAGWEERGRDWRGFSSGGTKVLFRFGQASAARLCVTEAAIDGLSLAVIEDVGPDTLYLSTGGGWSPTTVEAIRVLALRQGRYLVAATDNDEQGEIYAARLQEIAVEAGCGFERLRPPAVDWNAVLKAKQGKEKEKKKVKERELLPPAGQPRQG